MPSYESHPRSPSRSPSRNGHDASSELDPLLANLSPVSTLEALKASDAVPFGSNSKQRALSDSIANSSTSERALGIRAALAGKKLREWYDEVSGWNWPKGKFEPPKETIGEGKGGKGSLRSKEAGEKQVGMEKYLGSLPEHAVMNMEDRIEAIRNEMDMLDVEELKDHVRGAHLVPQSRSSRVYVSPESSSGPTYNHLDDFTVIITATIMQALPYIARLNELLDVWFIRILVLRQVPIFLRRLDDASVAVESAWHATSPSRPGAPNPGSSLTREAFSTMKAILAERVSELAQRLDGMLDALEGHEDRIPDEWIDDMEAVEEDFKTWVFEAERQVVYNEWMAGRESPVKKEIEEPKLQDQDVLVEDPNQQPGIAVTREPGFQDPSKELEATHGSSGEIFVRPEPLSEAFDTVQTEISQDISSHPGINQSSIHVDGASSLDGHDHYPAGSTSNEITDIQSLPTNTQAEQKASQNNPDTQHASLVAWLSISPSESPSHSSGALTPRVTDNNDSSSASAEDFQSVPGASQNSTLDRDLSLQTDQQYDFVSSSQLSQMSKEEGEVRRLSALRPSPLDININTTSSKQEGISDTSLPPSTTSSQFSNMSSPQIMDAAAVQFFKTPIEEAFKTPWHNDEVPEVPSVDMVSRQSSQRTERSTRTIRHQSVPHIGLHTFQRSRASSSLTDIPLIDPRIKSVKDEVGDEHPRSTQPSLRRASSTSIEKLARSEVSTMTINLSNIIVLTAFRFATLLFGVVQAIHPLHLQSPLRNPL